MAGPRPSGRSAPVHVETTVPAAEAHRLASTVLSERLAACAWRTPISSMYWWKGALESQGEVLVVFKTSAGRAASLSRRIRQLHPYEVPYLRTERMIGVPAAYLQWLAKETAKPRPRSRRARQ